MRGLVALALARLRYRPARWLLVVLGVAAATVLPVLAQSTATVVAAQALRYGVESLPPGQANLAAIRSGLRETPADIAGLDATARSALAELSAGPARVQMLTRAISDGAGGTYYYGGADALLDRVRITDGRAPASCTPTRCEVLAIGTGTPRLPPESGIVIVGRAVRTDPLLLAGSFDPADGAPLLLADGVSAAAQLEYLSAFQRSYSWVTPVDLDRVNQLGVEGYLTRSAQASLQLYQVRLSLVAPDEVLRSQAARAQLSARRFALLGGAATVLLLGFCVIGAIGLRRDHTATVELVRRRGGGRGQLATLAAIAGGVPVLAGAGLGLAVGGLIAAGQARAAGLAAWPSAWSAVRAATPAVGLGALAAGVVVVIALAIGANARAAWRGVDIVVVGGIVVAGLALARGVVTTAGLGQRTDPLLVALPVLVVVCGGLLVGRAWPFIAAGVARLVPRRLLAARLALVGSARAPLRPVATAAFLAAATGIVAFAGAYQGTLRQGAHDQAAFAVPLDAVVRTGQSLRTPLQVANLDQYAAAGLRPYGVVRAAGTVPISAARSLTPALLGVDPSALPLMHGWTDVVGGGEPNSAARLIASPVAPAGIPVAAGIRTLALPASGNLADVDLTAWLRQPDGRDIALALNHGDFPPNADLTGRLDATLRADLPAPAVEGTRLFAVTLAETSFAATRRQHHFGEGNVDLAALTGSVSLAALAAGSWDGWGSDNATVHTGPSGLTLDYGLTGAQVVVRAGFNTPVPALPVLVDPTTAAAAPGGALAVTVGAGPPIAATVRGVLPRFPTTGTQFVVADARALAAALDAREPGTGSVSELWLASIGGLDAAGVGRALAAPPFDLLRADLRQARDDRLASDPLARGAAGLLTGGAVLAFAVALACLVLLVVADRRDESAQLYAWESDGVAPRTLRRSLFLRTLVVVAVGVPGGIAIGLLLSRITTAIVLVTAVGDAPVPPLAVRVTPLWTIVAIAGGVAAGLGVCGLVAAAALRERLPRRPEEGLA